MEASVGILQDDGDPVPVSSEHLFMLLDMPYESEDELGELLDDDNMSEMEELSDEAIFDKVTELNEFLNNSNNAATSNSSTCDGSTPPTSSKSKNIAASSTSTSARPKCGSKNTSAAAAHGATGFAGDSGSAPNLPKARQSSSKNSSIPGNSRKSKKILNEEIRWREGSLQIQDCDRKFEGDSTLPDHLMNLDHPYEVFRYFFDDDFFNNITEQTLLYSTQKNPVKPLLLTHTSLQRYFGIIILSSLVNVSSVRDLWDPVLGNELVKETMSVNTFECIRPCLHFNDNSKNKPIADPNRDKLFKIRPILDHLNNKFSTVPMRETLSVDEQICSTKIKHSLRQYNPCKPKKWGYKLFVLCDDEGYGYKFEVYSGQENIVLDGEEDIGANSNVVVRLTRGVPESCNYSLYFDNYYTSLPLISAMKKKEFFHWVRLEKTGFPITLSAKRN